MKVYIFIFLSIICQDAICQLSLSCQTEKKVCLKYTNTTYDTAYFISPLFYAKQKLNKKKIVTYLRTDMYDIVNDTLQLYFTDTTLSRYNYIYPQQDRSIKNSGSDLVISLPPKSSMLYTICFMRKFKYRFIEVKYNFGFQKSDFFTTKKGYPVSVLKGNNIE